MTELLFREDAYLASCEAKVTHSDAGGIRLDRTVFYPEGGGQPGDVGRLTTTDGGVIEVVDTQKGESPDEVVHLVADNTALPPPGALLVAEIDWLRRYRLMRMHTCMHLLCALVDGEVTGGQVGDGKGRLDFNLPAGAPDKTALTEALNRLIGEDHPVRPRWIDVSELAAKPELVRTMSVKPPLHGERVRLLEIEGVDLQPCGGTHVRSTGEIGPVEIGKIENKGRQNRRINIRFAGS